MTMAVVQVCVGMYWPLMWEMKAKVTSPSFALWLLLLLLLLRCSRCCCRSFLKTCAQQF